MNLTGIDHFVLTVTDIDETCAFYESLGGEVITFDTDRIALQFGQQKINLHPIDNDIDLVAGNPTLGSGDLCLLTEQPIADVTRELAREDIEIIHGPVEQTGARGPMTSVYCRDPDDNLVEIATYDSTGEP